MLGLGFLRRGLLAQRLKELGQPGDWAYEMVFAALVGGLVGARLWSMIENWDEAKDDLLGSLFSGTGLVFYGGALGGAIAVLAWAWWRGVLGLAAVRRRGAVRSRSATRSGGIGCQLAGDGDYGKAVGRAVGDGLSRRHRADDRGGAPDAGLRDAGHGAVAWFLWRMRHRCRPARCSPSTSCWRARSASWSSSSAATSPSSAGLTARAVDRAGHGGRRRDLARAPAQPAARPPRRAPARRPGAAQRPRHASASTPRCPPPALRLPAASSAEDGRLAIGGCDAVALAREFGTPAYVMAEDDLRASARAFRAALAAHHDGPGEVIFASKAFPCTAVLRVFAEEGLGVRRRLGRRAAPRAARPGSRPRGSTCTATRSRRPSCALAVEAGVGYDRASTTPTTSPSSRGVLPAGARQARARCASARASTPTRTRRSSPATRSPSSASTRADARRARRTTRPPTSTSAASTSTSAPSSPTSSRTARRSASSPAWATFAGLLARRRLRAWPTRADDRPPGDRRGGRRGGRGRPRAARPRQAPRDRARAARSSPTRA